ncbi:MAG: glycosyltransferase [Synechococcaceae cyanobacterium]|jgi:glycosyltransferase involved in cell wall biosynthesis
MAVKPTLPLVSVVVPVYAGRDSIPNLITRCETLRRGTHELPAGVLNELIFVCDEPIDDSESILRHASDQRHWLQVISLARNGGQHLATAVGILYSSGDWILTIDEDLQHPPELLGTALEAALSRSLDILYIRSTERVHTSSVYRDITSRASKMLLRLFTLEDYSGISSFRLIRGEIGRAVAISIDDKSYLDAVLFAATSKRRRGVLHASFTDARKDGISGYNLPKLIRHYGRFIMSAEFSGLQLLNSLGILVAGTLLLLLAGYVVLSLLQGVQQVTRGWLSLFSLGLTTVAFIVAFGIYTIKLISVLFQRSTGLAPFLVIDRQLDSVHLTWLARGQQASLTTKD